MSANLHFSYPRRLSAEGRAKIAGRCDWRLLVLCGVCLEGFEVLWVWRQRGFGPRWGPFRAAVRARGRDPPPRPRIVARAVARLGFSPQPATQAGAARSRSQQAATSSWKRKLLLQRTSTRRALTFTTAAIFSRWPRMIPGVALA